MNRLLLLPVALAIALLGCAAVARADSIVFEQDFETDTSGWETLYGMSGYITRVSTGTNGIPSAGGSYHAIAEGAAGGAPFTDFDGYRDTWPGTWYARTDVYLDTGWGSASGFDFSVAATDTNGQRLGDFVFHVAQDVSTGALLVGGSTAASHTPRDDLETGDHHAVQQSGWFTFEHLFYDDGGYLAVDLNLRSASGLLVWSQTIADTGHAIPDDVGGNRYGWFASIAVDGGVAIDDTILGLGSPPATVQGQSLSAPEPATALTLALGLAGAAGLGRRLRRRR